MKAIIIGADSEIGHALGQALSVGGVVVYGTTRRPGHAAARRIRLDLADTNLDRVPLPLVDVGIFCAAISRFAQCRAEPALARRVNVSAPVALARRLVTMGARVIFLSTSAVFDWRCPHVRAMQPPCPVSAYGRFKAEAEAQFLAFGHPATIVRLTKVLTPASALIVRWIDAMSRGERVVAFSDLRMAPIGLNDAVGALSALAGGAESGIYQLSGTVDISYTEAARHLAERLGLGREAVIEERAIDHGIPPEEITSFSSLETSRLEALTGWHAPHPFAVIDRIYGPALNQALLKLRSAK
jgi:dTDP-4-dehydrorhamnose reductase